MASLENKRRPFAAFGLHADKARLAFHLLNVIVNALVVGDGEVQAAVGRDAVEDAGLAAVLQGLFQREIALEVDVVVDEGKVFSAQLLQLLIGSIFRRRSLKVCGIRRQRLQPHILEEHLCLAFFRFEEKRAGCETSRISHAHVIDEDASVALLCGDP